MAALLVTSISRCLRIHLFAATQLISTAQWWHHIWNKISFWKYAWEAGVAGIERVIDEKETDSTRVWLEKLKDEKPSTSCFSRLTSGLPSELIHFTGKEEVHLSRRPAASFWALLRSLALGLQRPFLFEFHGALKTRAPAQGKKQGGLEESVIAFLGQGGGLTDSFGILGDCGAVTTVLSYHNSLFLPPSPPD